jgi:hypothetical protein
VSAHTSCCVGLTVATLSALAVSTGCRTRDAGATSRVGWRVVDSSWITPWDEMTDSAVVFRVQVSDGAWADTVVGVIRPWPVVVDDSTVAGLRARKTENGARRELFRVRRRGRATTYPLPADMLYGFTDVAVSPGGRYLAYVGSDSLAAPYAVVRAFPGGPVLLHGPKASGCDCDVDLSHARWVSPDSFEVAVVNTATGEGWQIVTGNAAVRRLHVSFAGQEPDWHSSSR